MNSRSKNWLLYGALVLLPVVWLWPCAFGGKTFVPFDPAQFPPASMTLTAAELEEARSDANFDVTETWPWFLPETELVADRPGPWQISTWNPHARSGAPIQEVGLESLLYPPQRAALFVDNPRDLLVWQCWLSLALAGVFLAGLLREVGLSHLAAFFGAASFELSSTLAVNSFFWMRLAALIWLPAILWALVRLSHGDRWRVAPMAATAVAVAMPWLAGFPPFAAAGLFVAGLMAARLVMERFARDGLYVGRALVWRFGCAIALGLMLAAPQLLPSFWFFTFESARTANPGIDVLASTRFDTYGLLGYLMPDAYGHPIDGKAVPYGLTPLGYLWMDRYNAEGNAVLPNYNYTEYSVFFGTLGLVLAGYGAIRGRQHLRWWLLLVLAALFGLALFVPVVNWLFYLPLMKSVFAMRWLAIATPLLCWLAAIGFDRLPLVERRSVVRLAVVTLALAGLAFWLPHWPAAWHAEDPTWPATTIADRYGVPVQGAADHLLAGSGGVDRFAIALERFAAAGTTAGWWLLLSGSLLLAYGLLRQDPHREWLRRLLPLIAIVQLGLHGAALVPGQRLEHPVDTEVHAFLRAAADADPTGGFMIARVNPTPTVPTQLPPGQLMHRGIRDLQFYSHGDKRWIEVLRAVIGADRLLPGKSYFDKTLRPEEVAHPLFDLLGVRYVLSTTPIEGLGEPVGPPLDSPRGQSFYVYHRPAALPRAFTVGELVTCGTDAAVVERIATGSTDWRRQALVPTLPTTAEPPAGPGVTANPRAIEFARDDPTVVELEVTAGRDRWLVLTDTWFPGWTATVDGRPVAIERCNHCQRLVRLPASACRVRFDYTTNLLPTALVLHFAAVIALVLLLVRSRRSSSTPTGDETSG